MFSKEKFSGANSAAVLLSELFIVKFICVVVFIACVTGVILVVSWSVLLSSAKVYENEKKVSAIKTKNVATSVFFKMPKLRIPLHTIKAIIV